MHDLFNTANRLKFESSVIFALLLIAGVIVLLRDPQSLIGSCLIISSIAVGLLGFIINSIRENYQNVIQLKDEMIKDLTKERREEIKHSDRMRKDYESRMSNGWSEEKQ